MGSYENYAKSFVEGDTPWGHIGRTFPHEYMRALVHPVNSI